MVGYNYLSLQLSIHLVTFETCVAQQNCGGNSGNSISTYSSIVCPYLQFVHPRTSLHIGNLACHFGNVMCHFGNGKRHIGNVKRNFCNVTWKMFSMFRHYNRLYMNNMVKNLYYKNFSFSLFIEFLYEVHQQPYLIKLSSILTPNKMQLIWQYRNHFFCLYQEAYILSSCTSSFVIV